MIGRRVMRRRVVRGAVVAGGAYAVGKRVQRGRDEDAAAQEYAGAEEYVEEPQTGMTDDTVAQLEQLAQLKKDGILTEEEFAEQKARILGG